MILNGKESKDVQKHYLMVVFVSFDLMLFNIPVNIYGRIRTFASSFMVHLPDIALNEPHCEKPGLRGFRPGPTRTRLYSH